MKRSIRKPCLRATGRVSAGGSIPPEKALVGRLWKHSLSRGRGNRRAKNRENQRQGAELVGGGEGTLHKPREGNRKGGRGVGRRNQESGTGVLFKGDCCHLSVSISQSILSCFQRHWLNIRLPCKFHVPFPQCLGRSLSSAGTGGKEETTTASLPRCAQLWSQRLRTHTGLSAVGPSPGPENCNEGKKGQFENKHGEATRQ